MSARSFQRLIGVMLLFFVLGWFGSLNVRDLAKSDEGRYSEIPREMAASGDWITPRLNGLKYFEKPALQYWATAAAYEVFGEHEWTARLWPALTGFFGILLAWFTGRRLFGDDAGLAAGLILGSALLYAGMGHIITLDMGMTFFMQASLCGFLLANRGGASKRESHGWMLMTWAAVALAVLSKGIVAPVLAGGVLVFYTLINRDISPWKRLHLLTGLPLFFAIAAPWFIAVCRANPEFFHFFFIHEHFERFLTKGHNRYQPAWFFLPILLVGLLPWLSLLPGALKDAWSKGSAKRFDVRRFLLVWSVLIFAFFSVSSSKLPSYILPIFPALALLMGERLAAMPRASFFRHLLPWPFLGAAALLGALFVVRLKNPEQDLEMWLAYREWLITAAVTLIAGSAIALWLCRLGPVNNAPYALKAAWIALAFTGFMAGQYALLGNQSLSKSNSAAWLASQLPPIPAEVPFYSVLTYEQTLPFYLKRTLTLVEYGDELTFGEEQEPEKYVKTVADFEARWRQHSDAFALMDAKGYARLAADGLPMAIVARDPRRIIVRKPH